MRALTILCVRSLVFGHMEKNVQKAYGLRIYRQGGWYKGEPMEQNSESDSLSPEEFKQQLDKLSVTDVSKIMAVAKVKHVNGTGMEFEDLLIESIARVLKGSRKVPRNVPIVAYLIQTIRSIASSERKKQRKVTKDNNVTMISWEREPDEVANISSPTLSPEQSMEETEASQYYERKINELHDALIGNPNALVVLQGKIDGLSPKEIKEKSNMPPNTYDAARKKVDRALLRLKR